jgi:hypothetical protein
MRCAIPITIRSIMRPLGTSEQRRLGYQEHGWNLTAGTGILTSTRTRRGGDGRPDIAGAANRKELVVIDIDEDEDVSVSGTEEEEDSEDEGSDEDSTATGKKPPHTRVILEVAHVEKAFAELGCPQCSGPIKATLRTVCIASSLGFQCMNEETCGYLFHAASPAATSIHVERNDNFERSTDYAVNVLYILGFLAVGDGCTEAARLLGLLGLPNDTTMEGRSFTIIEERIGPLLRQACEEVVLANMIEEVKLSMEASEIQDEHDFTIWKDALDNKDLKLSHAKMPKVHASYDMAWQQKGSGHVYNSFSGHGVFVGRHTRKVIALVIKSKTCGTCNAWKKKHGDLECLPHTCWKNHEGSSGSMESAGCLELVVQCFERHNVIIERLCCDDDSSIRADCQWNNADYMKNNNTDVLPLVPKKVGKNKGKLQPRPDKGKLPSHVPEPWFVADPNHRRKGLTGELIKLDKSTNDKRFTMTRMDSTRIGKNFGYMARTLKDRPTCEFIPAATSVLDHHFDIHEQCGTWCKRKNMTEAQRLASPKYYRCKDKDAKLYAILQEKIERFITMDKLLEMAHGLDTNMNEAFNNLCTWFAPKNKLYAASGSLHNRIAMAVGIHSLGVLAFYKKLYRKMGIALTLNVEHYLEKKETSRLRKIEKMKTKEAKKEKNKRKYDKLKDHTRTAKIEFTKRIGTYRTGMNMDDPFGELLNGGVRDIEDEDEQVKKPAAKRTKSTAKFHCMFCGKTGHLTKRAKNCIMHGIMDAPILFRREDGSLLTEPPQQQQEPLEAPDLDQLLAEAAAGGSNDADDDAAADTDRFDSLPFIPSNDDDDDSNASSEYFDAMADSDDDDSQQGLDIADLI